MRKGFYPYEYVDDWEEFNKTSLPEKEDTCSHLKMEEITNADCVHAKRFIKILKQTKLGKCHDLYVESDTLLLTDVFEDFQNVCLEIGELDPTRFLTAAGLEWQAALTKTKVKAFS